METDRHPRFIASGGLRRSRLRPGFWAVLVAIPLWVIAIAGAGYIGAALELDWLLPAAMVAFGLLAVGAVAAVSLRYRPPVHPDDDPPPCDRHNLY